MQNRRSIFILLLLAIGFVVLFSTKGVVAQEGLLDGKIYIGQSVENHKSAVNEDKLRFANGDFYSAHFIQKGFNKGVYIAKAEEEKIYFESETVNPKQGKNIKWRGIIQGDSIEVNYRWRKKGWLSDTIKDYTFKGTLKK
jgi:hypothetical protein